MHRDMDLVRAILGHVASEEQNVTDDMVASALPEFSDDQVGYHLKIMISAGLLTASESKIMTRRWPNLDSIQLTWSGNDFYDTVRNPEVWKRTKEGLMKVGSWSLETMLEVAKAYGKQLVREKVGLDI